MTENGAPNAKLPFANSAGRYLNRNSKIPSSQCVMTAVGFGQTPRAIGQSPTASPSSFVNYEARASKVETRHHDRRFLHSGLTTFSLHERSLSHRRRIHRPQIRWQSARRL